MSHEGLVKKILMFFWEIFSPISPPSLVINSTWSIRHNFQIIMKLHHEIFIFAPKNRHKTFFNRFLVFVYFSNNAGIDPKDKNSLIEGSLHKKYHKIIQKT